MSQNGEIRDTYVWSFEAWVILRCVLQGGELVGTGRIYSLATVVDRGSEVRALGFLLF